MKPYGEKVGSTRGVPRRLSKPGGSYDVSKTEQARIRRSPKKRARQSGKQEASDG